MKKLLFLACVLAMSFAASCREVKPSVTCENDSSDVAFLHSWMVNPERSIKCMAVRAQVGDSLSCSDVGNKAKPLLSTSPGDSFMSMSSTSDLEPRLITVWVTGSAYMVRIYAYDGGQIRLVLEVGTKAMPEMIYPTKDAPDQDIVVAKEKDGYQSVSADVYRWNGVGYTLIKQVPWESRFK